MRVSIASPLMQPSPNGRRVGIRIVTFEACSGFTHVTAHRIAQPPKATFVTRLQPFRSPGRAARQLPDQSTILWVDFPPQVIRAFGAHCHKLTFHAGRNHKHPRHASSSSKAFACFKSSVSKPSVNQP